MTVNDPIVQAIAQIAETAIARGIEVRPHGDGWLIRLASNNTVQEENATEAAPSGSYIGRSW